MKILALDSSSAVAGVALIENDKLIGEYTVNHKLTHSQTLLPMVDELLKQTETKLQDIDVYAVSAGPGSFTGLRIGISTIKGFAMAWEKPVIGVSTLESMAYNHLHSDYYICPLMDARNQQVYNAVYRRSRGKMRCEIPPRAESIQTVMEEVKAYQKKVLFIGDGVIPNFEYITQIMGFNAIYGELNNNMQRAASVALLAYQKALKKEWLPASELNPVYLRKSQAERSKEEHE